jgi:ribosomal protein S18 acetylase RimI-like enzyme
VHGERDLLRALATLDARRVPGRFVFATVEAVPPVVDAVAMIEEDEGTTLVLELDEADRAGLSYDFVAARVTLGVDSALDAVGLTAAVASALAASGISCNVVAGYFHDHLYVPFDRAEEALAVLAAVAAVARSSIEPRPAGDLAVRPATIEDHDSLVRLWDTSGIAVPADNSREEMVAKLQRDPDLFLVAERAGAVVGSVMGSYDGRRGWIGRLCVDPHERHAGLASRLMAELEARLSARGCRKVNLLIEPDNAGVAAFYARLGYREDRLVFMEKWLR